MNVRLLKRVIRAIQREPRRFNMDGWIMSSSLAPCGTAACIGGHAIVLDAQSKSRAKKRPDFRAMGEFFRFHFTTKGLDCDLARRAKRVLGLETPAFEHLCLASSWPEPFYTEWSLAPNAHAEARVAVARIKHFIETKGEE